MNLKDYRKRKEFLVCVDSDGCAMDTMDVKHKKCFGPCLVEEWGLNSRREEILKRWNDINLYSRTRGINRFKGLYEMLREIDEKYDKIEGLSEYGKWVNGATELSNGALERAIREGGGVCLKKALNWSVALNRAIDSLPDEDKRPFRGVGEALSAMRSRADIAVLSSANRKAVEDEWRKFGLADCTDVILTQEEGSKAHCISVMLGKGYLPQNILMVGDAEGDYAAAETNGVLYFPILVGREEESWKRLGGEGAQNFFEGRFAGDYARSLAELFFANFK
ncbi:MAG: HAD family hydrolase [Candidatus Coproplasma sp.]